jgi:ABC-type transport system involved in multi-copper enzyme maturation permease subunit
MSTPLLNIIPVALILALFQVVAALPWVSSLDGRPFRKWIGDTTVLGYLLGALLLLTAAFTFEIRQIGELSTLAQYGRFYAAILHLQLAVDFVVLLPQAVLLVWPKGGAIAIAALRESLRQPMFWLIFGLAALLMVISIVIPYFTLGDDYKLMKQVNFDAVMLCSALFGLLSASLSVNEEIEGRTAITVISKPVSRRQFFIGKYLGILMACWTLTLLLGWVLTWTLYMKTYADNLEEYVDPMPVEVTEWLKPKCLAILPTLQGDAIAAGDTVAQSGQSPRISGIASWFGETIAHHLGLFRVFGQVMIMLAICTALATRVQFVVNLVVCLGIFLIGNLSPIMVHVTQKPENEGNAALQLVSFLAQLFNAIFPALDSFDMGPAIIRDTPLGAYSFLGFVVTVFLYSILYTAIAIFGGLLLFEDRDLA